LAKARNSIQVEREGDSTEMNESDLHDSKQDGPRISTEDAIVMSDEFEKTADQFVYSKVDHSRIQSRTMAIRYRKMQNHR
jgi:pimeloyl-CoA synthetase